MISYSFADSTRPTCRTPFTLLELLAAIAVFMVLLTIIFQIVKGVENFWTLARRKLEVAANANVLFATIAKDVKSMIASGAKGRRILVDAAGIGERSIAFVASDPSAPSNGSSLFEVGYGVDTATRIRRWSASDMDAQWNFLDQDPAIWAADASWGKVSTVISGAVEFSIDFYRRDPSPPYYALYNAVTDSDTLPAFVDVSMTLIHPRTIDSSATEQNRGKQSFHHRILIDPISD